MPKIAAFPKGFLKELVSGEMELKKWVRLASELEIDGLEFYSNFAELNDESNWPKIRELVESYGMTIPMMCCSPDFTKASKEERDAEIEKEKHWIRMSAALGAQYCRVLYGQRRKDLPLAEGLDLVTECIEACLPTAVENGVTLIIENHYKDDFWTEPEFAQKMDVFVKLIDRIQHPNFGVNYDPSNAFIAGDDPIELLEAVKHRVVTMHASDRYLISGTLEDLRREEGGSVGYVSRLKHGTIGKGLNDYDKIFSILKAEGFDNWISIEDGVEGMDQMHESARFLKEKISKHWAN
ncbi:MAG: sugar phosphate isomerase/epimerase family protein [Candidatus Nanopelagicales bacterium]